MGRPPNIWEEPITSAGVGRVLGSMCPPDPNGICQALTPPLPPKRRGFFCCTAKRPCPRKPPASPKLSIYPSTSETRPLLPPGFSGTISASQRESRLAVSVDHPQLALRFRACCPCGKHRFGASLAFPLNF